MPGPDGLPEQQPRRPLTRAAQLRTIALIVVAAAAISAVILRDGPGPGPLLMAAGCTIILLIAAVQIWAINAKALSFRWTLGLIWVQGAVVILLLVGVLIVAPITASVAGP